MAFFDDKVLLGCDEAETLYSAVKDLPIIDYHCHLNQYAIDKDDKFGNIGELWLAGDHYKWRAMRLCGIDEKYITGDASYKEKFMAYASILPKIVGNPLYYMTHLELKIIFGIEEPLNSASAERIWEKANAILNDLTVRSLLKKFNVEYIATTDDPVGDLSSHKIFESIKVRPTFRPDKIYYPTSEYVAEISKKAGINVSNLDELLVALTILLDRFVAVGCKITDHGFRNFPANYATLDEARKIFANFNDSSESEKDAFFGFMLLFLAKEYAKRNLVMQLHFSVTRNINPEIFKAQGVDRGCDVIADGITSTELINFLSRISDEERPEMILYSLNPSAVPMIACITGAYRKVRMGAAWWFNDTIEGIRANLKQVAEYSVLGTSLGMLTDSRSFSSYGRFDMFRRLLCDYIGGLVSKGEYSMEDAVVLVKDICYYNAKNILEL